MIDRLLCLVLGIEELMLIGLRKLVGESMWAEVEKRIADKRRES